MNKNKFCLYIYLQLHVSSNIGADRAGFLGVCRDVRRGVHKGICRGMCRGVCRGMCRGVCRDVQRGVQGCAEGCAGMCRGVCTMRYVHKPLRAPRDVRYSRAL